MRLIGQIPRRIPWFCAVLLALSALGQEDTAFTRVYDTVTPLAESMTDDTLLPRTGWRQVPEDNTRHQFAGDAVLLNDKLAVVFRKKGRGPEVYSRTTHRLRHRATLDYVGERSSGTGPREEFAIIENTSGGVMAEATFQNNDPVSLRFRLTTGEAILEIKCSQGTGFTDVQSHTRFVVVPDYFGDDLVYGPETVRGLCLPAENFCLNLLEGGDAILMIVWQSSEQDAWLAPASRGKTGDPGSSRIRCLKDKSIWLAFLESPDLWQARSGLASSEWKPPFPAKWRSSFVRENGGADSWDMDRGPSPQQSAGDHQGPLVIYPLDRSIATPLTATCPTDVMRNTLGVGPCQYILACEGLASQGDPTPNSVMGWVEKQFEQKKEKKAADDIKERLNQMAQHIADARSRIERYADFSGEMRKLLASKSDPFHAINDDLARFAGSGLALESSPERARQLAGEVADLLGQENAAAACRRLGEQLRSIGSIQDGTLAKCRMAVRRLKQQARTVATSQLPEAGLAPEVQRRAERFLQIK